jgi:hypothetical protein
MENGKIAFPVFFFKEKRFLLVLGIFVGFGKNGPEVPKTI